MDNCMKHKYFHAPFFNHFIQPSPPTISKSKSLHGVLRVNFPHKIGSIPSWLAPHLITTIIFLKKKTDFT